MTLVHPWLVLGVVSAVIPILLHAAARRRYRTMRWAATDLLHKAVARQAARLRRWDHLLLATRVSILIVAPLTLARPMLTSSALTTIGRPQSAVVIIVDISGSMRSGSNGTSALDAARSRANELLATLPTGSPIGLVGMEDRAVPLTDGLLTDRQRLAAAIGHLQPSWSGTQLQPALALAIQWLHDVAVEHKRIYLITDGRENVFTRDAAAARALLRQAAVDMELTVLPVAPEVAANVAITNLQIIRPASPSGSPATIRVHVAADADRKLDHIAVELWVDGRKADRRIADTGQGSASVVFQPIISDVGLHTIEAQLDPDSCESDNRRFTAFYVPERMDVAIATLPQGGNDSRSARTYLKTSLESIADVGLPWTVRPAVPTEQITEVLDDRLWLLILADCGPLPADAARRIGRFIEQGGACWVAGCRTLDETLTSFQRTDSPAASWMTILRPGTPATQPAEPDRPLRIKLEPTAHHSENSPIDLTADGARTAFATVNLFQVRHVEPATDSPWSVALRTNDNWPLLLTHTNHRLALLATSLDPTATDWPYRPAFVTLVDDLTYWLCKPRLVAPDATIGCKWQTYAPAQVSDLTLIAPNGQSLAPDKASNLVLGEPGVYRFSDGKSPRTHDARWAVAVNVAPDECQCPVWSPSQIAAWLPSGPFRVISPETKLDIPPAASENAADLWPFLAALLLGLLAMETALGHRFAAAPGPNRSSEVQV